MYPAPLATRLIGYATCFTLAVWLSGCASGLSKEECATIDWQAIGYEDGINGWSQTRIGTHRKACAKHGVTLDLAAYRQGWQEGIESYCQPGNGYRQGRSGASYQGICPPELEPGFMQEYSSGRELYTLEKDVQHLSKRLKAKRNHLAELETALRDTGIDLVAHGISTEQRVILLDDLRKMEAEHSDLRNHVIPELEHQLATRQADLAHMRADHQY